MWAPKIRQTAPRLTVMECYVLAEHVWLHKIFISHNSLHGRLMLPTARLAALWHCVHSWRHATRIKGYLLIFLFSREPAPVP